MEAEAIFFEISIILLVATLCAALAKFLRQPMIPAYILAGVLLGPSLLNVIKSGELLETLSTFGIAFLLFLVGIELDLRKFFKSSRIAIVVGFAQMVFAAGFGYLLNRLLGFPPGTSFFLAIALGFSSTIVILKLLEDKKELDTLYGQIVIGLMLTQDFIAVLFLIFFSVFVSGASGMELIIEIVLTIIKGFFLISLALISSKYILSYLFKYFARTPELLFLGSISWCLIFSILSILLGFSIEVGALLAGVSLAFLPYSIEISYRIKSLRDFFLPIFFAILGGQLIFENAGQMILPTIVLSSMVLFVFPILVIGLMLWFGYRARTSFQVGISIGQVSEFSFIMISLGYGAGILDREVVSLVALIGLVTMTLSAYMVEYLDPLYSLFRGILSRFERKKKSVRMSDVPETLAKHAILIGHKPMALKIQHMLEKIKQEYIVIDHDPDVMQLLKAHNIPHVYGSMTDEEVLKKAHILQASYLISTVNNYRDTLRLLRFIQEEGIKAKIIVTASTLEDAKDFYTFGAHYVLYPASITADYVQELLSKNMTTKRNTHKKELDLLEQYQQRR